MFEWFKRQIDVKGPVRPVPQTHHCPPGSTMTIKMPWRDSDGGMGYIKLDVTPTEYSKKQGVTMELAFEYFGGEYVDRDAP